MLDFELQRQLVPFMKDMTPLPGIYDPDFIAANQDTRADNIIKGSRQQQLEHIRQDIRDFHQRTGVDKVVILWTANTERYSNVSASSTIIRTSRLCQLQSSLLKALYSKRCTLLKAL